MKQELANEWSTFVNSSSVKVVDTLNKGMNNTDIEVMVKHAIRIGDKAPDFTLINQLDEKINLYSLLEKGAVVLTWYRGSWCPYCNLHLQYLQRYLSQFKSLGATLIALPPEKPDGSLSMKEKYELDFEVLSDENNHVAREFGIVFKLMEEVSELYSKTFKLDLENYNDSDSDELPIPATYVIDQSGIIRYAYLNPNYIERADPDDILDALIKITD